jgi:peptidyl-prolyl cis-trans isomerase A (cyclophilin A)
MLLASTLLMLAQAASPAPAQTSVVVPSGPHVMIDTSMGPIEVVLYQDKSPITVDNFLKYVRAGHYDGTIFHRVIPGFMIQGGGKTVDFVDRTGERPPIRNEARNGLRNLRGTLAMARTNDPNSATAQFFINVRDNASLDFGIGGAGYAVFGEVVSGMDVVDKIITVQTTDKGPNQNVPIKSVIMTKVREIGGPAPAAKPAAAAPKPAAKPSAKP